MTDLRGVITFSKGILCKKEALEKQYSGKIGGVDVTITLPTVCDDKESTGMSNPLIAPEKGKDLRLFEEIDWGYPLKFPGFNSVVYHALIEFSCDSNDVEIVSQKLYDDICRWEQSFIQFYELSCKYHFKQKSKRKHSANLLAIFSDKGHISSQEPHVINGVIYSDSSFVSREQIYNAISFASSDKNLLLEYQMLLSAYKAKEEKQFRQAIVDACAAVEICLNKQILAYCERKGIKSNIITSKYRYLSDKFNLLSEFDADMPKFNYKKAVVEIRNAVVHSNNTNPSVEETNTLISIVEEVLAHYNKDFY